MTSDLPVAERLLYMAFLMLKGGQVLSAPGIVINGKPGYTGGLDETALREHLKKLSGG